MPFVYLSTRFWAGRAAGGGRHLRVLESCALTNESRLQIVEIAGRIYVLAVGGKGVQVLEEVTAPETLAELKSVAGVSPDVPGVMTAFSWLKRTIESWQTRHAEALVVEDSGPTDLEALRSQLERLRQLDAATGDEVVAARER